ncbi:MAG: hypothetical protein JSU07_07375 [Bacteroidetes bacterium]|nr:hypothetical protein [Bacteroidota bacterium]
MLIVPKHIFSNNTPKDSIQKQSKNASLVFIIYNRLINIKGENGTWRNDQNVVANFKTTRFLRTELGLRTGQRPEDINSYFQYKIEVQSIKFLNHFKVFARMSQNLQYFPSPQFYRTNYMVVLNSKWNLSKHIILSLAFGQLVNYKTENSLDMLPNSSGKFNYFPIYKASLAYKIKKSLIECVYGNYDVFNPYRINQAFFQIDGDYEPNEVWTIFSYLRYQYNNSIENPLNAFFAIGIKLKPFLH